MSTTNPTTPRAPAPGTGNVAATGTTAAASTATAAVPPAVPPPPRPPTYSRVPAGFGAGALDYTQTAHIKLFRAAISPIPKIYDGEPTRLRAFLVQVHNRAKINFWNRILTIPNSTGSLHYILDEHGRITIEDCRAHALTYATGNTRQWQDSQMLYLFLSNSITEDLLTKVTVDRQRYTINGEEDGVCFLKCLISKIYIETRATVTFIRTNLSNLDNYMASVNSNILLFNQYVKEQRLALESHGHKSDDLLVNLFKGYMTTTDHEFVKYIRLKKDLYDEGGDVNVDSLMTAAETKYKAMVQEKTWNAPTQDGEQIVALKAQVDQLKKDLHKKAKTTPSYSGKGNPPNKSGRRVHTGKWAWKSKPPKSGEAKTKTVNRRKYHWCPTHKAWTEHSPDECTLKKKLDNKSNTTDGKEKVETPSVKTDARLQVSKALAMIAQNAHFLAESDSDSE